MCGRYYVDDETVREIKRLVRRADEETRLGADAPAAVRDIHPSELAQVITIDGGELCCRWQRWGFPGLDKNKLVFNARSESALEKGMFRESVEHRRAVIPAAGFYEWNKNKEKSTFYRKDQPVFMAGFYDHFQDGDRFVILTTAANASMKTVHDRMPLILERDELWKWLYENALVGDFLRKIPARLERWTEFEQLSLPF